MIHKNFGKGVLVENPNDNIYTPEDVSKLIISKFNLSGKVLDAFRGGGSFYNNYPENVEKYWCEIKDGVDFFDYHEKIDWIITNPPYSIFDKVLTHSFEIAENVVYLVPLSKVVSSMGRIRKISSFGGVPYIFIISAGKCSFPFGFPACAIYMKKDYKGPTTIEVHE